jgi:hypothetical protein
MKRLHKQTFAEDPPKELAANVVSLHRSLMGDGAHSENSVSRAFASQFREVATQEKMRQVRE